MVQAASVKQQVVNRLPVQGRKLPSREEILPRFARIPTAAPVHSVIMKEENLLQVSALMLRDHNLDLSPHLVLIDLRRYSVRNLHARKHRDRKLLPVRIVLPQYSVHNPRDPRLPDLSPEPSRHRARTDLHRCGNRHGLNRKLQGRNQGGSRAPVLIAAIPNAYALK